MIQRIQTLFLLAAAILHTILFFTPFWSGNSTLGGNIILDAAGVDGANVGTLKNVLLGNTIYSLAITVLNVIIILLVLATIFLYNNRLQQIKFCRINMALVLVLLGLMVFSALNIQDKIDALGFSTGFSAGIAVPVVSIILLFLAARRIRFDENLVRSSDRLR